MRTLAMKGLTLGSATSEDLEFAYKVTKAAMRPYVEQVWGWEEGFQRREHERRFRKLHVHIVHVAEERVGILSTGLGDDSLQVCQLFILPEHQSQGIGAACMREVVARAEKLDLPVRLRVLKVNERAVKFYEGLGFEHRGESDTHRFFEMVLSRD